MGVDRRRGITVHLISEHLRANTPTFRRRRACDAHQFIRSKRAGGGGGGGNPLIQEANRLDSQGKTKEARLIFQRVADSAATPQVRAAAHRSMAMSYGFDADCAGAVKYEEMVIDFWKSREQAEPQNAHYQQGEMTNEAARICIDVGQIDVAEQLYRRGTELGLREPEPRTHPVSLWNYRLAHALARVAARRGDAALAKRYVAEARRALDSDTTMGKAQERFFPYLTGYVGALHERPEDGRG